MGTIMQRLRDRIYNQTFIIVPRQPEENSIQDDTSSQNESNVDDSVKDCCKDSKSENLSHASINKEESSSTESNKVQQKKTGKVSTLKPHEAEEFEVYIKKLFTDLKHDNSIDTRCSGTLNLAVCLAVDSPDIEISDCLEALKDLCDSHDFPQLAVCHALLLCGFTKMSMSLENLIELEEGVVILTECLKRKNIAKMPDMYKVGVLIEEYEEITLKLCQEIFREDYLDLKQIDIMTICCCALYNISASVKQYDNDLGATYNFKDSTLKYILVMTGRSTQDIVSENLNSSSLKYSCPSMNSFRLKQCLHVLEHALSITPDLSFRAGLHHENSSLPHCLTRLLGWSVSSVFPIKDKSCSETDSTEVYFPFHLSTLVCILKILSILSFNPHQYDSFSNVKGLMEKILICTLKAYFESEKNHFDIQILCLEMLINLYIKNQKTFILLCLKRFRISETEEVLAVEALLKMLSDNLEKIKEVKGQYPQSNNKAEPNINACKEASKDPNEDLEKENHIKKPRKETVENVSKDDTLKNVRKEDAEVISNEDPIKKPRKESSEGVLSENPNEEPIKAVAEDASSDASKGKPEKPGKEASAETDAVLQAASKDMEHSTIVSFICVLIVFFMRTKQNFKEFILERLTADSLREATTVLQKFLEFASLTGGMPVTGILILSQTISKLQSLQSS